MAFVFLFQIIFSLSIAGKFGVTGVPTLILFYNGRPVAKFNRTRSLQGLEDFISHATGMSKQMFHLFFSTEQACLDVLKMVLLCGTICLCLAARMAQLLEVLSTDPRVLGRPLRLRRAITRTRLGTLLSLPRHVIKHAPGL